MKAVNGTSVSGVKRALSGNMANGAGGSDYTPNCILITGGAGAFTCICYIQALATPPSPRLSWPPCTRLLAMEFCRFHRFARRHRARRAVSRLQGIPPVLQTFSSCLCWVMPSGVHQCR